MYKEQRSTHWFLKPVVIIILIFGGVLGYWMFTPHKLPTTPLKIIINRGESFKSISLQLESSGIVSHPMLFRLLGRALNKDTKIIAGMYILQKPISVWDLLKRLSNGHPDEISITLKEGVTFKELRLILASESEITHLSNSLSESEILSRLKIPYSRMEGVLFPDTYFIAPGQSDLELMLFAYKTMQRYLIRAWEYRSINAIYQNPYELLIMASLIQKETPDPNDMLKVSTVFNNRLRKGMKLQDDPAVFYGLGNREVITRKNFLINTPYNTYLHYGLPPTPITTPSLAAINAAAKPESDFNLLYFIAIGSGKSKFSNSYEEHKRAIKDYLK